MSGDNLFFELGEKGGNADYWDTIDRGAARFKRSFVGFCRTEATRTRDETKTLLARLGVKSIGNALQWLDNHAKSELPIFYKGWAQGISIACTETGYRVKAEPTYAFF
jgi:hypothetical protein